MIEHAALVPPGARLLDVACGYGRHAKLFAARGARVTAVDRDEAAIASLQGIDGVVAELRDLEGGGESPDAWPYVPASFDAIVVCNYLWRPTFGRMLASIDVGGALLYETFMDGNERYGKPSRPDFLLRSNELIERTRDAFRVVAYREGEAFDASAKPFAIKAWIAAQRIR
ncbi:MAG: class I SAM-dependent methyltransferase [Casimicrobium sp.]